MDALAQVVFYLLPERNFLQKNACLMPGIIRAGDGAGCLVLIGQWGCFAGCKKFSKYVLTFLFYFYNFYPASYSNTFQW